MKDTLKKQGIDLAARLYARSNIEMAKPASPKIYQGIVNVLSEVKKTPEAYYNEENSITLFLTHFYESGWTVPKLIRAYKKFYAVNAYLIVCTMITMIVAISHVAKNMHAGTINYASVGVSTMLMLMFSIMYLSNNMHMWRIRNMRINGRPWLSAIRLDYKELYLKKLSKNYSAELRDRYRKEKAAGKFST